MWKRTWMQLEGPPSWALWLATNQCTVSHLPKARHHLLGNLSEPRQMNHSPKMPSLLGLHKQNSFNMTCFRQPKPGKINPTCGARQHYLLKLHLHFSGQINLAIYLPFLLGANFILHFCFTHAPTNFCFYHTFCKRFLSCSFWCFWGFLCVLKLCKPCLEYTL